MLNKISGIKSVDFKITAKGVGIVNWNGKVSYYLPESEKTVENHLIPKLKNFDPLTIRSEADLGEKLKKAKLFVSQNCIRHYLFKNENYNLQEVNLSNVDDVLCSLLGLVRGYVITNNGLSLKRKSALFLEDFVADNATLRNEIFTQSLSKDKTSLYRKTNADNIEYVGYGSINIEDLQFIVLEDSFDRSAYKTVIDQREGEQIAEKMTQYLMSMDFSGEKTPKAIFKNNYVRKGCIMKNAGEAGLLLNEDAISIIVELMLERIKNLTIRQSKGILNVESVLIDYNSGRPMRIKEREDLINTNKDEVYAVYFDAIEIAEEQVKERTRLFAEKKLKAKEDKKKWQQEKEEKKLQAKEIKDAKNNNTL